MKRENCLSDDGGARANFISPLPTPVSRQPSIKNGSCRARQMDGRRYGDEIYSSDREGECAPERETEKQFPLALKHILIRSKMIALWI
jgi:hypothetical protein